jgi:LacI family transcriptional regulator
LWAVIISDIGNPFYTTMVRGIEDVAQSTGYSLVLCNSDENAEKEARYIADSMDLRMAGVIICPASESSTDVSPLLDQGTPVVIVDRKIDDDRIDTVLVDNEGGAAEGTRHLISAGYRRIACITGQLSVSTAVDRLAGYTAALQEAGRAVDPDLIKCTDFRESGGFAAMEELKALPDPPDAVFTTNNLITLGVLRYLSQHPTQIGIVGFDDLPWLDLLASELSTVGQPAYEIGQAAAKRMVERIRDFSSAAATITLPTHLTVRHPDTVPR